MCRALCVLHTAHTINAILLHLNLLQSYFVRRRDASSAPRYEDIRDLVVRVFVQGIMNLTKRARGSLIPFSLSYMKMQTLKACISTRTVRAYVAFVYLNNELRISGAELNEAISREILWYIHLYYGQPSG